MSEGSNFNISDWQLRQLYSRVALLEETLQSVLNDWQNNVLQPYIDVISKSDLSIENIKNISGEDSCGGIFIILKYKIFRMNS